MNVTYQQVKNSKEVKTYIAQADQSLKMMGYTDHSFGHVTKCAEDSGMILSQLGYNAETIELAKIAGMMHDIGNVINREDHAFSGAIMSFQILTAMGMEAEKIAAIITAIGNHDEGSAYPVSEIAAALILADKTDVRRSRVRNKDKTSFDIHDRVNYAAEESQIYLDKDAKTFTLILKIDTSICQVMEYFEIFLNRMILCRKAAGFFHLAFKLSINGLEML